MELHEDTDPDEEEFDDEDELGDEESPPE